MKSIRRRISAWMLPGLVLVWALGGIAVYQGYRSELISAIDGESMTFARLIRMNHRSHGHGGPGWGRGRTATADLAVDGLFYQVWNPDGKTLGKSGNLGDSDLSQVKSGRADGEKRTMFLPGKGRVRVMEVAFGMGHGDSLGPGYGPPAHAGGGAMPMRVVIARDLTAADASLRKALYCIAGAGILMLGGMLLLLKLALRSGLRPLDSMAAALSEVDPSSLDARFSTGDEPRELRPIVTHLDSLMNRLEAGFLRERRFGADLAHELRTPIAEMRTKLELATIWPEERSDELFNAAQEIMQRMQDTVDTMLQLARLEGENGSFPMERLFIAPLVAESWSPHAALAAEKKLDVDMRCADGALMYGNPGLWKHILGNLFSNAVAYCPANGTIRLAVAENVLSLANTVDGLSDVDAGKMFERFWRADHSRSDSQHCGLGLPLVQACAQQMGYHAEARVQESGGERQLVIFLRRGN